WATTTGSLSTSSIAAPFTSTSFGCGLVVEASFWVFHVSS
ncbi:unnamed protein product, partial [Musa acuminata subsp. burmannicoides]